MGGRSTPGEEANNHRGSARAVGHHPQKDFIYAIHWRRVTAKRFSRLAQVRVNHAKSRIRARIEHVFGAQQNAPGGRIVRTIGIVRARAKIGLQNLAYNIRRLVTLERLAAA